MTTEFKNLCEVHNGEHYLTPTDLTVVAARPRRVLIVGSCLAEVWQSQIDCPCDFVMTNNLNELPQNPPQPIENYDLQLVQIPLRLVMPEETLWHLSFLDTQVYEKTFDEMVLRLQQYMAMACAWNRRHGILTLIANFLVPQQNPIGRFAPRYDLKNPVYFVEQLNVHLAKEIEKYDNAFLLDIDGISSVFGKKNIQDDAVDIQMHAALLGDSNYKIDQERIEFIEPMTRHYNLYRDGFIAAVWHQAAAMYKSVRQQDAVKLVILDLDNTLWRGVIAEDGEIDDETIEGWPLGLVEALVYLKKRGVILAIASRNEEQRIRDLWDKVMRGRLRLDEFAAVKINWAPKVQNVEDILREVNLLPRSVLFIDDNPVERAAVKAAFPEMRVLGKYPYYLKRILLWSPETQVATITRESSQRTEMVQAQVQRETLRKKMSREEFLATLEVKAHITEIKSVKDVGFARALELINKTNQFNTTGRRWTREECAAFFAGENIFYAFDVKDRFTDYGMVGCALVAGNRIEQFVMSCRVLGLNVEQAILAAIAQHMQGKGMTQIEGQLKETKDNFPCRDLYEKCGFERQDDLWIASLSLSTDV